MWFTCETFQAHVLVQSSNLHISEENTVAMCLYVCVLLFRMLCRYLLYTAYSFKEKT